MPVINRRVVRPLSAGPEGLCMHSYILVLGAINLGLNGLCVTTQQFLRDGI